MYNEQNPIQPSTHIVCNHVNMLPILHMERGELFFLERAKLFFSPPRLQLEEIPCQSIPFSKNTEAASIIYAEPKCFNVDVNSVSPHLLAE